MRELADTALQWVAEGRPAVLAWSITEQGFGPRHPADAVLIDGDGTCAGTCVGTPLITPASSSA
jgi:xanthine dehydrogenase accessory factor